MSRFTALVLLVAIASGCTIQDPTENTGPVKFVNDTGAMVTLSYCLRSDCTDTWFKDEVVQSGSSITESVVAGRGNLAVLVIRSPHRLACIRLAHFPEHHVRLSQATRAGCHRLYG